MNNFLAILSIFFLILLTSCDEEGGNLSQRLNGLSDGVKKFDSTAQKVGKGLAEFSEHAGKYMDTTKYKKDSTGKWMKK